MEEILKKIAYCYYLKFKEMGYESDPGRDYRYAEIALNHILKPRNEGYWKWEQEEEDFKEFRQFLPN